MIANAKKVDAGCRLMKSIMTSHSHFPILRIARSAYLRIGVGIQSPESAALIARVARTSHRTIDIDSSIASMPEES
jgi:hypothetical protein